ncbi:MAG: HDIG domain-containing protein [Prevotellaceae bacterium]|jgi:putative nucleotidyltransferase with HDIG domain|nr:HDIG domain-containing protein [Prevotellaceae bacterium]
MKSSFNKKSVQTVFKVLIFAVLAAAVIQLFPRTDKLNFHFEEGKPWSYDIITAPFDFPVFKSEKDIANEKYRLLHDFVPYFSFDTATSQLQIRKIQTLLENEDIYIQQLVTDEFIKVYENGIVESDYVKQFAKDKRSEINCIYPNRISKRVDINNLYTQKTAYEAIISSAPQMYSIMNDYNLNLYLKENVKYDSLVSESYKNELLKGFSQTTGMVLRGEKIIDRGEIVTAQIYAKLRSLGIEYEKRNTSTQQSMMETIGEIILILVFITLLFLYIYVFRPRIYDSLSNLFLIALMILLIVAMTALTIRFSTFSIYFIPFTLLPVIIRVFFDSRTALFSHLVTVLILTLIVDNPFQFVILQIAAGMITVSNMKDLTQRSQLARTALYVLICYLVTYIGLEFIAKGQSIANIHWLPVILFAISSFLMLFSYILIYFIEKIFGLVSSITLVELTNINSDFMIKFAEKAPGSFQHTLQVSNLATEAAKAINANALLVRTGALYHDIGKSLHPEYFTENQAGGNNPLLKLDFAQAAKLIIAHVADGVQIAKKHHIPEQIIKFITTHHGTSKTKYFYNSFINANAGVKPNDADFTYPGPRPNTKETAILMMVDAVEARSHSLQEYTVESIDEMVEDMIDSQIADGQFKEAPISFLDVEKVKSILKEKVKSIYHTRITYPPIKE